MCPGEFELRGGGVFFLQNETDSFYILGLHIRFPYASQWAVSGEGRGKGECGHDKVTT